MRRPTTGLARLPAILGALALAPFLAAADGPGGGDVPAGGDVLETFLRGEARSAFFRDVEARLSTVRSLAVEFDQEKKLRIFKETMTSRGLLLFERPDRLRWETREPFRSILVVAGSEVAKFETIGGRRRALKLGREADMILLVMDRIRGWFQGKFEKEGERFEVEVAREPRPRIVLSPRDESFRKKIRRIEVELAPDLARVTEVTIVEGGEDRTRLRFRELGRNLDLPQGAFSVEDPREIGPGDLPPAPPPAPAPATPPAGPGAPAPTDPPAPGH